MTSKIFLSVFCISAMCLMASCTKDPHWPPSHATKGDITGKVTIYDSLGRALSDHSGVRVTLDSSNLSTITDASGAYTFKKVKAGRYSFTYAKPGYGTYRIIRQLHAGSAQATQLPDADVGKIYDGPPVTSFAYFGLGGTPDNPRTVILIDFAYDMRLPTASVLYMDSSSALLPDTGAAFTKTNFRANIRYNAQQGYQFPTQYQTPEIDPEVIRADSVLLYSRFINFYLAFDNIRDIHYIDEQGRTIYPCTGAKLGQFNIQGSIFQWDPNNPNGNLKTVEKIKP